MRGRGVGVLIASNQHNGIVECFIILAQQRLRQRAVARAPEMASIVTGAARRPLKPRQAASSRPINLRPHNFWPISALIFRRRGITLLNNSSLHLASAIDDDASNAAHRFFETTALIQQRQAIRASAAMIFMASGGIPRRHRCLRQIRGLWRTVKMMMPFIDGWLIVAARCLRYFVLRRSPK